ncbi:MAG: hypothetical protein KAJ70_01955 [Candidatus Omnitrophica bacterium]|nr:hypothetical protein [Candidatus Omnitrophota bacterium]
MRKIRRYLLILWIGSSVLLSGISTAEDRNVPAKPIEVIVQGRQYKSIRAYKREQIKNTLKRTLSSHNLMEFSEDELLEIMREVRKQQTARGSFVKDLKSADQPDRGSLEDQRSVEQDALDLGTSQMREMLKEYRKEHKGAGPLFLDPDKIKSVIIKPQKRSEETIED